MKIAFAVFIALAACIACYFLGYSSGTKTSLEEQERRSLLDVTLAIYDAAHATNWTKAGNAIEIEVLAFTRDYERRFGTPKNTDSFSSRFARAKVIADEIEKKMMPVSSIATNLGSNATIQFGK